VPGLDRTTIEVKIRGYFDACNSGDPDAIASYFAPDAVHYFPAGAPQGPFIGAPAIGQGWKTAVEKLDSRWTVDRIIIDEDAQEAVIEWTHFKPAAGVYLRGDEWYRFNNDGSIAEIRAYYACPTAPTPTNHELGGFDYANRGYPLRPPDVLRTN
jgi:ketosteroid isomerase-like protein